MAPSSDDVYVLDLLLGYRCAECRVLYSKGLCGNNTHCREKLGTMRIRFGWTLDRLLCLPAVGAGYRHHRTVWPCKADRARSGTMCLTGGIIQVAWGCPCPGRNLSANLGLILHALYFPSREYPAASLRTSPRVQLRYKSSSGFILFSPLLSSSSSFILVPCALTVANM